MRRTHLGGDRYRQRLSRGARFWDFVSGWSGWVERWQGAIAALVHDHLELRTGQTVLDVGCGRGELLALLRAEVGADGHVSGVDYSAGMVRQARARIDTEGWHNVEVYQGDACQPALGNLSVDEKRFDAAVSTFAISAMPDVRAAVENVHAALQPGGRFLVIDVRLEPEGWSRVLAWFLRFWYRVLAGWTGQDVLVALRRTFQTIEVVKAGGSRTPAGDTDPAWVFVAVATKGSHF